MVNTWCLGCGMAWCVNVAQPGNVVSVNAGKVMSRETPLVPDNLQTFCFRPYSYFDSPFYLIVLPGQYSCSFNCAVGEIKREYAGSARRDSFNSYCLPLFFFVTPLLLLRRLGIAQITRIQYHPVPVPPRTFSLSNFKSSSSSAHSSSPKTWLNAVWVMYHPSTT